MRSLSEGNRRHLGPGGHVDWLGNLGRLASWCRLVVGRDDGRIDSENRIARNRAGTETRGKNPGRRGDHPSRTASWMASGMLAEEVFPTCSMLKYS